MAYERTQTCVKCGNRWEIYKLRLIMRDKDSLECDCGETLIKWNGAVMYTSKLVDKSQDSH
ncbi:hypothetical protein AMS59_13830 [Lysinibacillus sp. FJAT-14745]|uniref:hypothetical protein n=1 Tax=Lysinibacillus sp. FJAT-14745 TaxID=1704289 RepID=UPI0006ABCFDC|nr:hypothetical protein [Lysinibacillus sp. FJAT-14745]KOP78170.1 hypothetical protein AMS59_13830 [Lysinibacillus sp. FJAT-14745]